jgi:hypothetical protein
MYLMFCQSYVDYSLWAITLDLEWEKVANAPTFGNPGEPPPPWIILGVALLDGVTTLFGLSFDPLIVWKLNAANGLWENYGVQAFPFVEPQWSTIFQNQPVWTGNASNKFFMRLYTDNYAFRDLISLDIVNKTWARQAYFMNSGSRFYKSTGEYNQASWPVWDGEKQQSWWYNIDGAPYWSRIYSTVGYWDDLMPHEGSIQSLAKPSRLLCIGDEIFFCGNPDFGAAYYDYPIMQKTDNSYMFVREGPGFHWGRECCYTGSHILARNPGDYSVWAFNDEGWKEMVDAPKYKNEADELEPFNWFDCCYAGGIPKAYAGDIEW